MALRLKKKRRWLATVDEAWMLLDQLLSGQAFPPDTKARIEENEQRLVQLSAEIAGELPEEG